MHADAGAFADRIQAIDDAIVHIALGNDDLAIDVGGNTTHLVVDRGNNGNGLARDVHVGEVDANFVHRGQALVNGFCAQVVELEQHVVFIGSAAAAFLDFLVHG